MPLITPNLSPAETLLQRIGEAYQSPHVDAAADRADALQVLESALKTVPEEVFLSKARQAAKTHGKMRYKLAALVLGRFWEQTYESGTIQSMAYKPPPPWEGVGPFTLEP